MYQYLCDIKNANADKLYQYISEIKYIISNEDCHTNIEGIYVAGDTRVKTLRQLTTAVSDGSIAATTAIKELRRDE